MTTQPTRFSARLAGRQPLHCAAPREAGMVLVTVLILLVVLTILGVTTMTNTGMEEKMAANVQEYNRAFQAAESGISRGFRETGLLDATATEPNFADPAYTPWRTYNFRSSNETAQVDRWYEAQGRDSPPGYSMGGPFRAHYFKMRSNSTTTGSAASLHNQGYYVIGPGT